MENRRFGTIGDRSSRTAGGLGTLIVTSEHRSDTGFLEKVRSGCPTPNGRFENDMAPKGQRDFGGIRLTRHALERFVERFDVDAAEAEPLLRVALSRTRKLG